MAIKTFMSVALVLAAALGAGTVKSAPILPFYDSGDLTPRWHHVDHTIADFSLVTQTGEPIRRDDLIGRVHVATFIYTRCANVCPAMVTQLKRVTNAIADRDEASIVAFTVTPQSDTPETLAGFGSERNLDPRTWRLVTGDPETIYQLARTLYFADDGRLDAATPATEQFLHTEKALLVDREGKLRGVYNATLPNEIDKLIADLSLLLPTAR